MLLVRPVLILDGSPHPLAVSILLSLLSCLVSRPVSAQETEDTDITPEGRIEFEISAEYTVEWDEQTTETMETPILSVDAGIREQTELSVEWSGYQLEEIDDTVQNQGTGDGEIELKQLLTENTPYTPRTALLLSSSLPVGNDQISGNRFDPAVLGVLSLTPGGNFTVESHAGVEWTTEMAEHDTRTIAEGAYAAALLHETHPSTELFIELYGTRPLHDSGTATHTAGIGAELTPVEWIEVTSSFGRGLSDAAPDHQLTLELEGSF